MVSIMSMSLSSFLASRNSVISQAQDKYIHVVTGNESADLDSVVCAISYAWFKQHRQPCDVFVPLINIERQDFILRTEITFLFRKLGIDSRHLIFRDDPTLQMENWNSQSRLRLILVDHNLLSLVHKTYAGAVIEVVDHHKDENHFPSVPKEIALVGSCCTLVAERILQGMDASAIDPVVATALLSAVLIGLLLHASVDA